MNQTSQYHNLHCWTTGRKFTTSAGLTSAGQTGGGNLPPIHFLHQAHWLFWITGVGSLHHTDPTGSGNLPLASRSTDNQVSQLTGVGPLIHLTGPSGSGNLPLDITRVRFRYLTTITSGPTPIFLLDYNWTQLFLFQQYSGVGSRIPSSGLTGSGNLPLDIQHTGDLIFGKTGVGFLTIFTGPTGGGNLPPIQYCRNTNRYSALSGFSTSAFSLDFNLQRSSFLTESCDGVGSRNLYTGLTGGGNLPPSTFCVTGYINNSGVGSLYIYSGLTANKYIKAIAIQETCSFPLISCTDQYTDQHTTYFLDGVLPDPRWLLFPGDHTVDLSPSLLRLRLHWDKDIRWLAPWFSEWHIQSTAFPFSFCLLDWQHRHDPATTLLFAINLFLIWLIVIIGSFIAILYQHFFGLAALLRDIPDLSAPPVAPKHSGSPGPKSRGQPTAWHSSRRIFHIICVFTLGFNCFRAGQG